MVKVYNSFWLPVVCLFHALIVWLVFHGFVGPYQRNMSKLEATSFQQKKYGTLIIFLSDSYTKWEKWGHWKYFNSNKLFLAFVKWMWYMILNRPFVWYTLVLAESGTVSVKASLIPRSGGQVSPSPTQHTDASFLKCFYCWNGHWSKPTISLGVRYWWGGSFLAFFLKRDKDGEAGAYPPSLFSRVLGAVGLSDGKITGLKTNNTEFVWISALLQPNYETSEKLFLWVS